MNKCAKCRAVATVAVRNVMLCGDCGRERLYETTLEQRSDISEHMPLLRLLASRCKHVTEFGMRWARGSTLAFLAGQPETFISWDLDPKNVTAPQVADLCQLAGRTSFQPRTGDTLKITIEPTELLFIDTLHTGKQLLTELERHCDPKERRVSKYLVFHDTVTFGLVGEDGKPGLRTAIRQFQSYYAFPLWKLMDANDPAVAAAAKLGIAQSGEKLLDLPNNNGLIVLEHVCANGHSPDRVQGRCSWCGLHLEG